MKKTGTDACNPRTSGFRYSAVGMILLFALSACGGGDSKEETQTYQLSANAPTMAEGDDGSRVLVFTITLSAALPSDLTLDYATRDGSATSADNDYTALNDSLTVPADSDSLSISVDIHGDTRYEPDETLTLTLSNLQGVELEQTELSVEGTILADDDADLSLDSPEIVEGDDGSSSLTFTISLNGLADQPLTLDYTTVDGSASSGSDYSAASGSVSIALGASSATVSVDIHGDTDYEGDESFSLVLSNAQGIELAQSDYSSEGMILADDPAVLSLDSPEVSEGDEGTGELIFTLRLSGPAQSELTLDYATSDGSATSADSDYAAAIGSVSIGVGDSSATLSINVNGDTQFEPDETLTLTLSNPQGVDLTQNETSASGTILADDHIAMSIDSPSVTEGDADSAELIFTISLSDPATAELTLDYASSDGSATEADNDYSAVSGSVVIAEGMQTANVSVFVNGDAVYEPEEILSLTVNNPQGMLLEQDEVTGEGSISNDDNADPKGYFAGSATVDTDTEISDLSGMLYDGRLMMFSRAGSPNVLYDITIDNISVEDLSATADVYVDGLIAQTDMPVTGTTDEAQITLELDGTGVASGSFVLDYDVDNASEATYARIETDGLNNWQGDWISVTNIPGNMSFSSTGSFGGSNYEIPICGVKSGGTDLPTESVNVFILFRAEIFQLIDCSYVGLGYTGFGSVTSEAFTDSNLIFSITNGEFALFGNWARNP